MLKHFTRREEGTTIKIANESVWRHLVDLGSHFGAHWILKGSQNQALSYNAKTNKCPDKRLGRTCFGDGFVAKTGGLEKWTQAFRIIRAAKQQFSGSHET